MPPEEEWAQIVAPWRAAAERHGFVLVKRKVELIESGHRCVDYLRSRATWLDLAGELGATTGFWSATLTTWIDAGEARFSLTTVGEAVPRPRPRGVAGWIASHVVANAMRRLAPPDARPLPLRTPEDLKALVEKHAGELLAIAGKAVRHETLEERFEQARRDEAG